MEKSRKILKIIIIGDSEVGKTALITRFVDKTFQKKYIPTIGVDFRLKNISLNNEDYTIQIWDTAGQERFRTITKNFFRGAHGVLICFDLSNQNSLFSAKDWLSFSMQEYDSGAVSKVLVGTKADLPMNLDQSRLEKYENDYKIQYFMTSSKTGINIEETFDYLINQIRINVKREKNPLILMSFGKTDEEEQKDFYEKNIILKGKDSIDSIKSSTKCTC